MPTQGNAVVLTALGLEYEAVREFLDGVRPVPPLSGTQYETGSVTGEEWIWQVTIARIGEGNANAALHCERIIRAFQPHIALFVGVAGSLRRSSVRLGDIVVATRVAVYQGGKDGDRFRPRPRTFECSHIIGQLAGRLAQRAYREQWLRRLQRLARSSDTDGRCSCSSFGCMASALSPESASFCKFN